MLKHFEYFVFISPRFLVMMEEPIIRSDMLTWRIVRPNQLLAVSSDRSLRTCSIEEESEDSVLRTRAVLEKR